VQPEKGNETLSLLRDLQSRRVLVARKLLSSASTEIEALIEEVLALGVAVLGVVSDKQESRCLAIARKLPGIPYQWNWSSTRGIPAANSQFCQNLHLREQGG